METADASCKMETADANCKIETADANSPSHQKPFANFESQN
ncbi:hypothetical protein [Methanolapillus millepedarum]